MKYNLFKIGVFVFFWSIVASANSPEYLLSQTSEEYNTHYLFHGNIDNVLQDSIYYAPTDLEDGFVLEIGALQEGQKSCIVYNDSLNIIIKKESGHYYVNSYKIGKSVFESKKVSLYFVNAKVHMYIDEILEYTFPLNYNVEKRVGIRWNSMGDFSYSYFNGYEPKTFKVADYGNMFDSAVSGRKGPFFVEQHVGRDYSITYPSDKTFKSAKSIRFEYRYVDAHMLFKTQTQRGRSEISAVSAESPMSKWFFDFDLLIPSETKDDPFHREVLTQIHDFSSVQGLSPSFALGIEKGALYVNLLGNDSVVSSLDQVKKKLVRTYQNLGRLQRDSWHHIKIYVKQAYDTRMMPLTIIWVDGREVFRNESPNCYNYKPRKQNHYDYAKFGIYKWGWLNKKLAPGTEKRIYYFDNYVIKY